MVSIIGVRNGVGRRRKKYALWGSRSANALLASAVFMPKPAD